MLTWLIRRRIAAFERAYGYDTSYVGEMLEADPHAVMALGKIQGVARYRRDVPLDAWYAAKLVAVLAEDCGPCTQLVVTMAEKARVPSNVLRAVIARDEAAMSTDVALAFRFAEAVVARSDRADTLREAVVARWGKRALISLSFAITASRFYPAFKYALGHGQACMRVTVGGATTPVLRRAA
ncbi:MAG TPA: hypothetical protein VET85_05945 [Stellaceae bacterium]|nr:hypothetical protein [Stellaceae bacterium]